MTFNDATTVEQMVLETVTRRRPSLEPPAVRETLPGWAGSLGRELRPARWKYVPASEIPRKPGDVMVEAWPREVSPGEHDPPRGAGAG